MFGGGGRRRLRPRLPPSAAAPRRPGADNPAPIPSDQDPQRDIKEFSVYVFNDAQDTWEQIFGRGRNDYERAQLVLYSGAVSTEGCGGATSAVGPFYCPADSRVYLDLTFYEDMRRQLGAPGDFAWAYVIAHEIGHHVQNLLGTNDEVADSRETPTAPTSCRFAPSCRPTATPASGRRPCSPRAISRRATSTRRSPPPKRSATTAWPGRPGGGVNPDSFTHGSSEQRRHWFDSGYESGDPADCDTFRSTRSRQEPLGGTIAPWGFFFPATQEGECDPGVDRGAGLVRQPGGAAGRG